MTARAESSDDEPIERHETWMIRETGAFHSTSESINQGLKAGAGNSPFQDLLAADMFRDESLRVLSESESEATFVLDLDMSPAEEGFEQWATKRESDVQPESETGAENEPDAEEMRLLGKFFGKGMFVQEISVSKLDESITSFVVMKLAKPLRQRFLFKMTTLETKYYFSYIEGCDGYAVDKYTLDMKGSALGVGKFSSSVTTTFTDVVCEQPVRFLSPD
ncbi:MAG: hypothetical protein F4X44_10165 [Gammaproteobacteria bacterium]|nr:hypothetical protein [Gammaproteobacteria bacterium]